MYDLYIWVVMMTKLGEQNGNNLSSSEKVEMKNLEYL
jgi:hypothetical protein